jgi:hypothetical protein
MPGKRPTENHEQPKASALLTFREIGEACLLWLRTNRPGVIKEGPCCMELHAHVDDAKIYARITEQ